MDGEVLTLEPPAEEEREWLLDGLATLIRRHGFAPLVASRILRATREDFPDDVPEGAAGVRVLLLRLLWHAGMVQHRARLKVYEEKTFTEVDLRGLGHGGAGTAAWFAGIEGDVCEFGVNTDELRVDREELIGTLGHEVAHAFRYHHGLVVRDHNVEERLTDLTSVYLGFGVFLLNSSASFKTGGVSASGDNLLYEKRQRGYLSPGQIAFLLAAQVTARSMPTKELRALAASLAPNHRKLFEDSCRLLTEPARLRERLGVPEPEQWPPRAIREPRANDLPLDVDEPEDEPPPASAPDEVIEWDAPGPPVRRIVGSYAGLLGIAGGVAPLAVGAIGLLEGWLLLGAALAGGLVGTWTGRAIHSDTCSECRAPLPRAAERCARCRGVVRSEAPASSLDEDEDEDLHDSDDVHGAEESGADLEPAMQLLCAMYAAWAIERHHLNADLEEEHAELIVGVHCGTYATQQLSLAWQSIGNGLDDQATAFFQHYFSGHERLGSQDYERLTEGAALVDSRASYARVAGLLDSRFEAWQRRQQRDPERRA